MDATDNTPMSNRSTQLAACWFIGLKLAPRAFPARIAELGFTAQRPADSVRDAWFAMLKWFNFASWATSGGEGAALSNERDE